MLIQKIILHCFGVKMMNRFLLYLKILSILDIIFANKYDLIIYDKKGNKKTQTTFDKCNKTT